MATYLGQGNCLENGQTTKIACVRWCLKMPSLLFNCHQTGACSFNHFSYIFTNNNYWLLHHYRFTKLLYEDLIRDPIKALSSLYQKLELPIDAWSLKAAVRYDFKTLKLLIIAPQFSFQYCQPAQNQPNSHFLFHKNVPLHEFYIKRVY